MTIEVRGTRDAALRARVRQRLAAALGILTVAPVRARAAFVDDNGPKGGLGTRCTLTVTTPFKPGLRVERRAISPRAAFDAALPLLERQLERYRERDRDARRYPKKYYAARRLL